MIIEPTVGRVAWFYPSLPVDQPYAATVSFVHGDRMVNLAYFDHNGNHHAQTSVPLIQEGDIRPMAGFFCEWMPYQLGQAKKHAG